jgi:hypothetical protein
MGKKNELKKLFFGWDLLATVAFFGFIGITVLFSGKC